MTNVRTDATSDYIIDVLTLGFIADPILRWLYPEPRAYLENFPKTARLFGGAAFANETALNVDGGHAAAMWLPPDSHPDGDGLMALFEAVLSHDVLEDAYKVFEIMDEIHPTEPCWHLAFVATDPASRRKGYGSALIEHVLPRCDAEQKVAYLENTNPANTALYERHGFHVIGEIQAGKAPPMLAMRRDPH
ncbi:MAG TPA: N-acetyltransferase [Kiloniellaceae bacterium]|nr:N-acetyltransferase [Kiloniellaceae bacterium]